MSTDASIPSELDLPRSFGFTMRGWDFTSEQVREAITHHHMLNPAMELCTNVCPWNCDFCFTESPANPDGRKRRLNSELPLSRRIELIDEAAALGAQSINIVGAGEPTIDPDFWAILKRIHSKGLTPILYSEGSLKLSQRSFCQRLFDLDTTVVLKVNSLNNWEYQDRVLRGVKSKAGVPRQSYSERRAIALDNLRDLGFNDCVPTRLAFDTIICRENIDEIDSVHCFARAENIFVLFVNYLPSGRTSDGHTTAITWGEQHEVFRRLARFDEREYGLVHGTEFPYSGGVPCTIRGLGLFVKIAGPVYDCPGESLQLGNAREESLASIWERARPITGGFDGGCLPRQQAWASRIIPLRVLPESVAERRSGSHE